jgi:aspartyl-tRNA(Asn)/glutamyl-tRNA(Gln) amidotransferase subunit C
MKEDKITKEQVLHVANLGRLAVNEQDIEKYQYQLKDILDEIEKITNANIDDDSQDKFINPSTNVLAYNDLRSDEYKEMLTNEQVLKNANKTENNYIEVIGVINE